LTDSELFRWWYKRGDSFDTTVFPVSTLLFYLGSNVLGIVYVNMSNLKNYRGNPLLNKFASYYSLLWTVMLTPVLFLLSTIIVLRSPDSLSSLSCSDNTVSCVGKPYSRRNCFNYNVLAWNGGYVYGLCMTYFKLMKLKKFNLVAHYMREWPLKNWIVFITNMLIATYVILLLWNSYTEAGV
jgi:hypothetical protein